SGAASPLGGDGGHYVAPELIGSLTAHLVFLGRHVGLTRPSRLDDRRCEVRVQRPCPARLRLSGPHDGWARPGPSASTGVYSDTWCGRWSWSLRRRAERRCPARVRGEET